MHITQVPLLPSMLALQKFLVSGNSLRVYKKAAKQKTKTKKKTPQDCRRWGEYFEAEIARNKLV